VNPLIRQWLRNEKRLGLSHWVRAVSPPEPAGRTAPPAKKPSRPGAQSARPTAAEPRPRRTAATPSFLPDDPDLPPLCDETLQASDAAERLAELDRRFVTHCTKCRLHENRTQTVFGVGDPRPRLAFVGEGPGADEDAQGIPFVGRAGQLLTRMIAAMTLTREQVYICNVVKCRPPGNRTPTEDEMTVCSPYLMRQLAILRPQVIVTLGRPATQCLLVTKVPISKLRGQFHDFPPPELSHLGLPPARLMPTFHPAYLLRNPPAKADAWEDLKQVMAELGLEVPRR
jgi:DNA polymerase